MFGRHKRLLYLRSIFLNKTSCNIDNLLSIAIGFGYSKLQTISECLFETSKQCYIRTCISVNRLPIIAYCDYLSQKLKRKVRLPYEWEWRRAARGFADYRYPWGERYLRDHALLSDATQVEKYPHGAPPGSFPGDSSPSGVMDMAGNVREFALRSNGDTQLLMVMGGSYLIPPGYADIGAEQFRLVGERGDDIGFRCLIEE